MMGFISVWSRELKDASDCTVPTSLVYEVEREEVADHALVIRKARIKQFLYIDGEYTN